MMVVFKITVLVLVVFLVNPVSSFAVESLAKMPVDFNFLVDPKTGQSGMEFIATAGRVTVERVEFLAGNCGEKAISSHTLPATIKFGEKIQVLSTKRCRIIQIGIITDKGNFLITR
jgi:hypothetical protein